MHVAMDALMFYFSSGLPGYSELTVFVLFSRSQKTYCWFVFLRYYSLLLEFVIRAVFLLCSSVSKCACSFFSRPFQENMKKKDELEFFEQTVLCVYDAITKKTRVCIRIEDVFDP